MTLKRSGKMYNGRLSISHDEINSSFQTKNQNNVADFFYIRWIVHYKFVPTGQTVIKVYYLVVLERLREKVGRKLPEILTQLMDLASRQ
jgi:hypothetical protein